MRHGRRVDDRRIRPVSGCELSKKYIQNLLSATNTTIQALLTKCIRFAMQRLLEETILYDSLFYIATRKVLYRVHFDFIWFKKDTFQVFSLVLDSF